MKNIKILVIVLALIMFISMPVHAEGELLEEIIVETEFDPSPELSEEAMVEVISETPMAEENTAPEKEEIPNVDLTDVIDEASTEMDSTLKDETIIEGEPSGELLKEELIDENLEILPEDLEEIQESSLIENIGEEIIPVEEPMDIFENLDSKLETELEVEADLNDSYADVEGTITQENVIEAQLFEIQQELTLFEKLKKFIEESNPNEKSEMDLEAGDYFFNETLILDNEKDITLNSNTASSFFKRSAGFTQSFFNIKAGSTLTLNSIEDGLIFDGENKVVASTNSTGRFIHNEGKLYINGATFTNDRSDSSMFIAPIVGTGAQSYTEFNSGLITNTDYRGTGGGNAYSSGGFHIKDDAELVMKGGTITNNKVSWFDTGSPNSGIKGMWTYQHGVGAVLVRDGGNFIMTGGEISNNAGYAGGVHVGENNIYAYERNVTNPNDLKILKLATMEMNGGIIKENIGLGAAGGIVVFGSGDMILDGGEISNNTGYGGGGILTIDTYVDGTQDKKTTAKTPFEIWQELYPAALTMLSGKVNDNFSYTTGGGINVSSNNVILLGGEINGNTSLRHGGGVYVTTVPYVLRIENALITNNNATHEFGGQLGSKEIFLEKDENGNWIKIESLNGTGGGVWFCPTGDAIFYAENGAAIFDNSATAAGDDFHNDQRHLDYKVYLPERLLGGGEILWYYDEFGNRYDASDPIIREFLKGFQESVSLKAIIPHEDSKELAQSLSKLFIMNNTALKGGGVGSNATVIFGRPPEKEIEIIKSWDRTLTPEEIEIKVLVEGKVIQIVTLNKENEYKFNLTELPATVRDIAIENLLTFEEVSKRNYNVEIGEFVLVKTEEKETFLEDVNETIKYTKSYYEIVITNKPDKPNAPVKYGDLVITKTVIGGSDEEVFDFKLTLTDRNDVSLEETFDYVITKLSAIIAEGKIISSEIFNLRNGASIRIKQIPYTTKYVIEELTTEGYRVIAENAIGEIGTSETFVNFTNIKENPPEEPEIPEYPYEIEEPPVTSPEVSEAPKETPKSPTIPEIPLTPSTPIVPEEASKTPMVLKTPLRPGEAPRTFDCGIGIYGILAIFSLAGLYILERKRKEFK
ncbi:MAG: hypothetical protein GX666_02355 [Tissierellia bacterium]|nr:hypothetical protein [Tissierellia bacterium]